MLRLKKNENKYLNSELIKFLDEYVKSPLFDTMGAFQFIEAYTKQRIASDRKMRLLTKEKAASFSSTKAGNTRTYFTSIAASSIYEKNAKKEILVRSVLNAMEQHRQKYELIFGNREGSDLTEEKSFGLGASKKTVGCYQIPINALPGIVLNEWVEFVITYDNKFILNYTSPETVSAEKKPKFDFSYQKIGYGTFLKAAGKIKIKDNAIIVISPFSKYFQIGWDYTPIILFVLEEMGLSIPSKNIFLANEQGIIIYFPETHQSEDIVRFYFKKDRFSSDKALVENKHLDIKEKLSKLLLKIDESILSIKTKKDILGSKLIDHENYLNLKTDLIDVLLALTRNDLAKDALKFTKQTIDTNLSEIYKNCVRLETKLGISIQEEVLKTIYSYFCKISNLVQNKNASSLIDNFNAIISVCEDFSNFNINTDIKDEKADCSANLEKVSSDHISKKLDQVLNYIQSINKCSPGEYHNTSGLKETIIKAICENLHKINEYIFCKKNANNMTLKEFVAENFIQLFEEINEYIMSLVSLSNSDLSFTIDELNSWIYYILQLQCQLQNNPKMVKEKESTNASKALNYIEISLQEFKKSLPLQQSIDKQSDNFFSSAVLKNF